MSFDQFLDKFSTAITNVNYSRPEALCAQGLLRCLGSSALDRSTEVDGGSQVTDGHFGNLRKYLAWGTK